MDIMWRRWGSERIGRPANDTCSGKGSPPKISGNSACFSSVIPRSLLRGASFTCLNNKKTHWEIIFLLPNLELSEPIGNDQIAIVPSNDQRVVDIVATSLAAKSLVENFQDQFGKRANPAVLLIRKNAPSYTNDIAAIVCFRNIFAISIIIKGHEHRLASTFVAYPLYSDFFDFYPITISQNNDGFLIDTPSVRISGYKPDDFMGGQTSPGLAISAIGSCSEHDLFSLLEKVWIRRFIGKRLGEWKTTMLFRSLEMAYQATTMPFKNHSTIDDFGTSASLWVSAFEVSSHPRKGKADLPSVLNLLGKYDWADERLRRKVYKVEHRRVTHKVNLVQMLYKQLYDTRKDFLHGNPVTPTRLHPFRNKKVHVITSFAPLIYKVALLCFLDQIKDRPQQLGKQNGYMMKLFHDDRLSEAILRSKRK